MENTLQFLIAEYVGQIMNKLSIIMKGQTQMIIPKFNTFVKVNVFTNLNIIFILKNNLII